MEMDGKTVLVTGSTDGVGRCFATAEVLIHDLIGGEAVRRQSQDEMR